MYGYSLLDELDIYHYLKLETVMRISTSKGRGMKRRLLRSNIMMIQHRRVFEIFISGVFFRNKRSMGF